MKINSGIRRPILVLLALAVPVLLIGAAGLARVQAQPWPPRPTGTAGKFYKNVRILKDLPAERLIPTMHEWNNSLGVQCTFCHTVNPDHTGFDRDDKPQKRTARLMLTMAMDLNRRQKVLGGKVTCFTCHHGHPEPENHPGGSERR